MRIERRATNGVVEEIDDRGPGRKLVAIDCPFCGDDVVGFLWSLAGSGKKCACGAVVLMRGAYKKIADEIEAAGGEP